MTETNYYQAIGLLYGLLVKNEADEKLYIRMSDGSEFPIVADKKWLWALYKLVPRLLYFKVYPQYSLKNQALYFKVYYWSETPFTDIDLQPSSFILKGLWQFIPQQKRPVFTIHRNQRKKGEDYIKSQHLPLIWKDCPPYRFIKDSDVKPKFYQIEARFLPQRGCFGFSKELAPATDSPKYIKRKPASLNASTTLGVDPERSRRVNPKDKNIDRPQKYIKDKPKEDGINREDKLPKRKITLPPVPNLEPKTVNEVEANETETNVVSND
jgi:hypothetical protein